MFKRISDQVLRAAGPILRPPRARRSLATPGLHVLSINTEVALGAAINAAAVFERLKVARPDVELSVVCNALFGDLLRFSPHVDRLFIATAPLKAPARILLEFLGERAAFARSVDCLLLNIWNQRLAAEIPSLAFRRCTRIGGGPLRSGHIRHVADPDRSFLDNNLVILKHLEIENLSQEPRVYYSSSILSEASERVRAVQPNRPVVALITQTSGGQPSRWFDDRFIQLAETLALRRGFGILFLGGPADRLAIDGMREAMTCESYSYAGETSVPQLAAILSQCDLVVTLDTGAMHVARGVGTPTVVIASAWQPMHEWLPIGVESVQVIRKKIDRCQDCSIDSCATRECMREISVNMILTEVDEILERFPVSVHSRDVRGRQGISLKSPDIHELSH